MSIEAMKMALDALEHASSFVDGYYVPKGKTTLPEVEAATAALREAIKQAESEAALEKMADNARELGLGYESAEQMEDAREAA